jgi:hypothetical protein
MGFAKNSRFAKRGSIIAGLVGIRLVIRLISNANSTDESVPPYVLYAQGNEPSIRVSAIGSPTASYGTSLMPTAIVRAKNAQGYQRSLQADGTVVEVADTSVMRRASSFTTWKISQIGVDAIRAVGEVGVTEEMWTQYAVTEKSPWVPPAISISAQPVALLAKGAQPDSVMKWPLPTKIRQLAAIQTTNRKGNPSLGFCVTGSDVATIWKLQDGRDLGYWGVDDGEVWALTVNLQFPGYSLFGDLNNC